MWVFLKYAVGDYLVEWVSDRDMKGESELFRDVIIVRSGDWVDVREIENNPMEAFLSSVEWAVYLSLGETPVKHSDMVDLLQRLRCMAKNHRGKHGQF
jgi:hypothetical protein